MPKQMLFFGFLVSLIHFCAREKQRNSHYKRKLNYFKVFHPFIPPVFRHLASPELMWLNRWTSTAASAECYLTGWWQTKRPFTPRIPALPNEKYCLSFCEISHLCESVRSVFVHMYWCTIHRSTLQLSPFSMLGVFRLDNHFICME